MKTKIWVILALVVSVGFFSSCRKQTKKPTTSQISSAGTDLTLADNLTNDMFNVVDNESKNGAYKDSVSGKTDFTYKSLTDTCALVTFNNNGGTWPKTLTVDFGEGCTNLSTGVTRKGKVIISFSGMYRDAGSVISATTDNYYVNGNKIEGTKSITNNGRNTGGNLVFEVHDDAFLITKPDGGTVTWESVRQNEWVEGESTTWLTNGVAGICDDMYSITGFAEGTSSEGDDYRMDVVDPLIKEVCCRWVTSGSIAYKLNGYDVATVSYGDGTCDARAEFDYDGRVYVIWVP